MTSVLSFERFGMEDFPGIHERVDFAALAKLRALGFNPLPKVMTLEEARARSRAAAGNVWGRCRPIQTDPRLALQRARQRELLTRRTSSMALPGSSRLTIDCRSRSKTTWTPALGTARGTLSARAADHFLRFLITLSIDTKNVGMHLVDNMHARAPDAALPAHRRGLPERRM
jgi:hypothetical protein